MEGSDMAGKREGLIAEQRVDRNGNTVTRWVKPVTASAASVAVPAPAVAAPAAPQVDIIGLTRAIIGELPLVRETTGMKTSAVTYRAVATSLMQYPLELLERLADPALRENEWVWDGITFAVREGYGVDEVSESLYFLPGLGGELTRVASQRMISSLHGYPQLPYSADFSKEDALVREQCSALLRFASAAYQRNLPVFRNEDYRYALKDHALVDLIMANPDKVELMVTAMRDRGSADPELLKSVLDNDAGALHHGVL